MIKFDTNYRTVVVGSPQEIPIKLDIEGCDCIYDSIRAVLEIRKAHQNGEQVIRLGDKEAVENINKLNYMLTMFIVNGDIQHIEKTIEVTGLRFYHIFSLCEGV